MRPSSYRRTSKIEKQHKNEGRGRIGKPAGVYIGFVKDNTDAQRMGRLKVWIPEFGSFPTDENGWFTVSYCSPFAGATDPTYLGKDTKRFEDTQTSYGLWMVPPDLENQVIVMFINGDTAQGIWIGSLYQQFANQMVPGIAANKNFQNTSKNLPVAEYNKLTTDNVNPNDAIRPIHKPSAEGIGTQGLVDDRIRGVSTSSARREAPSEVYGLNTPGPIDTTSRYHRLGGHQLVFDDKSGNELIRIKTRSGSQILLNESDGIVYIINKKGTGWIELSDSGHIDIFGKDSISIRSGKDFNLRADRDINIEAGRNINVTAAKNYTSTLSIPEAGSTSGGNIVFKAYGDLDINSVNYNVLSTENIKITASDTLHLKSDTSKLQSSSTTHIAGNIINVGASGKLSLSGSSAVIESGGSTDVAGTTVNLVGSSIKSSVDLTSGASSSGATSAQSATTATPTTPTQNTKTNKLNEFVNPSVSTYLTVRKSETVQTTTKRLITLEPCPEHENTGSQSVDSNRSLD